MEDEKGWRWEEKEWGFERKDKDEGGKGKEKRKKKRIPVLQGKENFTLRDTLIFSFSTSSLLLLPLPCSDVSTLTRKIFPLK